ncbi:hypothetical protein BEWA_033360 [Theileria equi strain WA]|uniref:Uncharacterized protein n=1 Tax=Theileria equi strain WA TaxID=1537102 RepID=L0AZ18_THEEQ|nr:hypothetical protein BEWA_033360 [Theileria equi strain WA]AFZ80483.1 hypothetical protein BEWA_033360 [Theileria equi strain WA]|eukprot:XP_004830149.1 hypothetical protein BEWA_033360 [Theileria equi strain WA]
MAFFRNNLDDQSKTHFLTNLPDDAISHIRWSSTSNPLLLSAGSWDKTLRIWKLSSSLRNSIASEMVMVLRQDAPVLTSCFTSDGTKLFGGGCTNNVTAYDLNSGANGMIVARHQKPISGIHWASIYNLLITTSWDGSVSLWDGRQETPVWTENVGAKIFASDFKPNLICVADSEERIHAWDLQKIQHSSVKATITPNHKGQLRSLSLFPDLNTKVGVVFANIAGRCFVNHFVEGPDAPNFAFKCHRSISSGPSVAYAVNAVDFNTVYGTFVTGGGDGSFTIWDKDNKTKIKPFNNVNAPVVDVRFSSENNLLAYATSYDWQKGLNKLLMSNTRKSIGIIKLKEEDVKRRPKTQGGVNK